MIDYPAHLDMMWQKAIAPRQENAPTVISTFAGGGGSLTGYMMAGFRDLLAVEWENNAVETLRLNWPELDIYHGDIAKLSVDEVLKRTGLKPGELDILDGSPPCQGFSTAGKRMMDDPRNQLFREYVRLLQGLQPKVFIMENVSGMVKGKMKLVFVEILKELKASGYQVSAKLLNAMYFHVPQSRQRMIFIGVRNDLEIMPSHPKAESRPISISKALNIPLDYARLEYRHSYKAGGVFETGITTFDKPCQTITKASNFSVVRYGDKIADLAKPVNTIARLQRHFIDEKNEFSAEAYQTLATFPNDYKLLGSFQDKKDRIGNSVPPLFMEAISRHVRAEILDKVKV